MYERAIVGKVRESFVAGPPLIQAITGPRQVGKSTAARQIAEAWPGPVVNASADLPLPPQPEWVRAQWDRARQRVAPGTEVLLVLDEVQKVARWSEVVKALWDEDRVSGAGIQVIVLGSSSLLLQHGLSESLAGRFMLHRCLHWDWREMSEAFSVSLDRWLFFGGYPGTAALIEQEAMWGQYVRDSLIESVLARDVLQLQAVAKPALLRHLFLLSAIHPAQILSYNKMLGQLQDAGNTTTLAHYVRLLESAFLLSGLELFNKGRRSHRGSSPKLVLWNNALCSALSGRSFAEARDDHSWWGRLVENAVGAHLLCGLSGLPADVCYWRKGNNEVDFVVQTPRSLLALEVKSGRRDSSEGLSAFCRQYPEARPVIVGSGGIPLAEFFSTPAAQLVNLG